VKHAHLFGFAAGGPELFQMPPTTHQADRPGMVAADRSTALQRLLGTPRVADLSLHVVDATTVMGWSQSHQAL